MKVAKTLRDEPVRIGTWALVVLLIALQDGIMPGLFDALQSYGVNVTPELRSFLLTVVTAVVGFGGEGIRMFTSPAYKLDEANKAQFRQQLPTTSGTGPFPPKRG